MVFILKEQDALFALEQTLTAINQAPDNSLFITETNDSFMGFLDIKHFVSHFMLNNPAYAQLDKTAVEQLVGVISEKNLTTISFGYFTQTFLHQLLLLNNQLQHEQLLGNKKQWPELSSEVSPQLNDKEKISEHRMVGPLEVFVEETIGVRPEQQDTFTYDVVESIPEAHAHLIPSLLQKTFMECKQQIDRTFTPQLYRNKYLISPGSTALVVYLHGTQLFIANTGDSVAALFFQDEEGKYQAMQLNLEHAPKDILNHRFITANGGTVNDKGQINNSLSVGRAFGDTYLGGVINAQPDIFHFDLAELFKGRNIQLKTMRLLISCDGAFEMVKPEKALFLENFCRLFDAQTESGQSLASQMLHAAFNAKSKDNITTMEIILKSLFEAPVIEQLENDYIFALYDGHGTSKVAEWLKNNFVEIFQDIAKEAIPELNSITISTQSNEELDESEEITEELVQDEIKEETTEEIEEEIEEDKPRRLPLQRCNAILERKQSSVERKRDWDREPQSFQPLKRVTREENWVDYVKSGVVSKEEEREIK